MLWRSTSAKKGRLRARGSTRRRSFRRVRGRAGRAAPPTAPGSARKPSPGPAVGPSEPPPGPCGTRVAARRIGRRPGRRTTATRLTDLPWWKDTQLLRERPDASHAGDPPASCCGSAAPVAGSGGAAGNPLRYSAPAADPGKGLTLRFSDAMMDRKVATLATVLLMGQASGAWARTGGDAPALQPAAADSVQRDPDRLAGGFEETKGRRSARVARKLGVGLLSGSVLTIVGRHRVDFAHAIGPGAGAILGVVLVDRPSWNGNRRSPFLALAGSSVGVLAGALIVPDPSSAAWNRQWHLLLPPMGATIASELWRDPSQVSRLPIADARRTEAIDIGRTSVRIARKLGDGAGLGTLSGFTAAWILLSGDSGSDGIGAPAAFAAGWLPGSIAGTAYGVSHLDPYDRFPMALFGSLLGSVVGLWASDLSGPWSGILPLFVCPAISATIASELSRSPPESGGLSIGLIPGPRALSMVATLHY